MAGKPGRLPGWLHFYPALLPCTFTLHFYRGHIFTVCPYDIIRHRDPCRVIVTYSFSYPPDKPVKINTTISAANVSPHMSRQGMVESLEGVISDKSMS
jgi:hypothetical protein